MDHRSITQKLRDAIDEHGELEDLFETQDAIALKKEQDLFEKNKAGGRVTADQIQLMETINSFLGIEAPKPTAPPISETTPKTKKKKLKRPAIKVAEAVTEDYPDSVKVLHKKIAVCEQNAKLADKLGFSVPPNSKITKEEFNKKTATAFRKKAESLRVQIPALMEDMKRAETTLLNVPPTSMKKTPKKGVDSKLIKKVSKQMENRRQTEKSQTLENVADRLDTLQKTVNALKEQTGTVSGGVGGRGPRYLGRLRDVEMTSAPTDGQYLKYDIDLQKWTNATVASVGGFTPYGWAYYELEAHTEVDPIELYTADPVTIPITADGTRNTDALNSPFSSHQFVRTGSDKLYPLGPSDNYLIRVDLKAKPLQAGVVLGLWCMEADNVSIVFSASEAIDVDVGSEQNVSFLINLISNQNLVDDGLSIVLLSEYVCEIYDFQIVITPLYTEVTE
jgi:hypothetical protein